MSATGTCEFQPKDYKSDLKPIWCPGCGDFGVVQGIYRALAAIGRPPHEIAFVSGIGCSSRIPGYTTAYGFNSVHGRALPIAQGIKLANPDLLVLAAGGDGDGFSIGGGHIAHLIRRNMDITYIVMDNQIYGLTKGQLSPTSQKGRITCTSRLRQPGGAREPAALRAGLRRRLRGPGLAHGPGGHGGDHRGGHPLPRLRLREHPVPLRHLRRGGQQIKGLKAISESLESLGHNPADRLAAMDLAQHYGEKLHLGVFYRNPEPPPTYGDLVKERQDLLSKDALPKERILDLFIKK